MFVFVVVSMCVLFNVCVLSSLGCVCVFCMCLCKISCIYVCLVCVRIFMFVAFEGMRLRSYACLLIAFL